MEILLRNHLWLITEYVSGQTIRAKVLKVLIQLVAGPLTGQILLVGLNIQLPPTMERWKFVCHGQTWEAPMRCYFNPDFAVDKNLSSCHNLAYDFNTRILR